MKKTYFLILLFFTSTSAVYSQNSKDDWVTYVSQNKKGAMSILVNLYYDYARPSYKNLLVVGTSTRKCQKNGHPNKEGLEKLYSFSDSIASIVEPLTKNRLVGVLTYQCTGFDVFYVKDTLNLRNKINQFYTNQLPNSKNYLLLERDKRWTYYKEKLFPKDLSDSFFLNHEFLTQLVEEGDDLTKSRKVDHWISFRREKRRRQFLEKIKVLNFEVDSLKFKKNTDEPYELKISRLEKPLPEVISELTKILNKLSINYYGTYQGWGTEPVLKD